MITISCVSYLNAAPFVYGLQASEFKSRLRLCIEPPAECAASFIAGKADAALVPVGVLPQDGNYQIITDYCIGASDSVYSVCLFANNPVHTLKQIYLDNDSRTSVKLVKVLLHKHWHINPQYAPVPSYLPNIEPHSGCMLIGDKTFSQRTHYGYIYDLAQEWHIFTGLPFVFALWIAHKDMHIEDVMLINRALEYGTRHRDIAAQLWQPQYPQVDAIRYLTENIDFTYDTKKTEAMLLFQSLASTI